MKLFNRLVISVMVFLTLIFLGAYVYHQVENWRYLDSLYFTVMTVTTVGYGDFVPTKDISKIFTMVSSFLGIAMAFYFFSLIGKYLFKKHHYSKLVENGRLKGKKGVRKIRF